MAKFTTHILVGTVVSGTLATLTLAANVIAYRTDWDLTYIVIAQQSQEPGILANPALGIDGTDASSDGTGQLLSGVIG